MEGTQCPIARSPTAGYGNGDLIMGFDTGVAVNNRSPYCTLCPAGRCLLQPQMRGILCEGGSAGWNSLPQVQALPYLFQLLNDRLERQDVDVGMGKGNHCSQANCLDV